MTEQETIAIQFLDVLMRVYGETGLVAAGASAGLLAEVDRHVAGIRDSTHMDVTPMTTMMLGSYAHGVFLEARRRGWSEPMPPINWDRADWPLCRLLAVCWVYRSITAG